MERGRLDTARIFQWGFPYLPQALLKPPDCADSAIFQPGPPDPAPSFRILENPGLPPVPGGLPPEKTFLPSRPPDCSSLEEEGRWWQKQEQQGTRRH